MKILLLLVALLFAVALSSSSSMTVSAKQRERAMIKFNQPVQLLGVVLKGDYLFVHDDAAMTRGEACTFVYKGQVEDKDNLVISFHCIPQSRDKAASFTVRTVQVSPGINELREIQFAGTKEAHLVPTQQGLKG